MEKQNKKDQKINVDLEMEKLFGELDEISKDLKEKVKSLVKSSSDDKNFRRMVHEKEITQFLSGYTQIQKLKLDVLKEIKKDNEEQYEIDLPPEVVQEILSSIGGNPVMNLNLDDVVEEFPLDFSSENNPDKKKPN